MYQPVSNKQSFMRNYSYNQDPENENKVLKEKTPAYIELGHELIHSWRNQKGLFISDRGKTGVTSRDLYPWPEEELQTVGINYTDAAGNPLRNYASYDGIISENGLRLENGLNVRISYNKKVERKSK